MKLIRGLTLIGGLAIALLALGFVFQIPLVIQIWPWSDGRYSYLFIGSIFAAVSAAALWIGATGELGALPAGSLNVLVITLATTFYFFQQAWLVGRSNLIPFAIISLLMAVASVAAFMWSRRLPLSDSRPTPRLVRISFGIFIAALFLAGAALLFHAPIFPWPLNPDSSVIFGCIFLGDAFYFLHALFHPRWHNALGQLLSFLAYDLVLIVPFIALFPTVRPENRLNLIVYVIVLLYSSAIAIYYLFLNRETRFGS